MTFKGSFVYNQFHRHIQPEVPVENIIAMYEAYKENCQY